MKDYSNVTTLADSGTGVLIEFPTHLFRIFLLFTFNSYTPFGLINVR